MGLLGEVQAVQASKHSGKRCGIAEILESLAALSEEDAADLEVALKDGTIMHTTIAEVLTNRGYRVSDNIISHHRRNKCVCARG